MLRMSTIDKKISKDIEKLNTTVNQRKHRTVTQQYQIKHSFQVAMEHP